LKQDVEKDFPVIGAKIFANANKFAPITILWYAINATLKVLLMIIDMVIT